MKYEMMEIRNDEVVGSVWAGGRVEERYWCEVRTDPLPTPWKQGENFWSFDLTQTGSFFTNISRSSFSLNYQKLLG